jgi:hypothetical protein
MKGPMKIIVFEEHYGLPFVHDAAREANELDFGGLWRTRKWILGSEAFVQASHRKDRLNFDRTKYGRERLSKAMGMWSHGGQLYLQARPGMPSVVSRLAPTRLPVDRVIAFKALLL